mgnify:CR=1 FL=1
MNKQVQKGGANSTNIQVEELSVVQGLTYPEVRQVAIDVFKANFYDLAGEAKAIASDRAEKVTEDFLKKYDNEHYEHLIEEYEGFILRSKIYFYFNKMKQKNLDILSKDIKGSIGNY